MVRDGGGRGFYCSTKISPIGSLDLLRRKLDVKGGLLLDIIVGEGPTLFELLTIVELNEMQHALATLVDLM